MTTASYPGGPERSPQSPQVIEEQNTDELKKLHRQIGVQACNLVALINSSDPLRSNFTDPEQEGIVRKAIINFWDRPLHILIDWLN